MTRHEVLQRIEYHVRRVTRRPLTVNEELRIDYRGLGLNSVQTLSMLVCLEDELGVEVDDLLADLQKVQHVSELVDFLLNASAHSHQPLRSTGQ